MRIKNYDTSIRKNICQINWVTRPATWGFIFCSVEVTKITRRSYSDYGTKICSTHHISTHACFGALVNAPKQRIWDACVTIAGRRKTTAPHTSWESPVDPEVLRCSYGQVQGFLMHDTAWGRCVIGGLLGGVGGRDRPCWQWGRLRAVMRGARYGAINRKIEARRLGKRRLAIEEWYYLVNR